MLSDTTRRPLRPVCVTPAGGFAAQGDCVYCVTPLVINSLLSRPLLLPETLLPRG